jgi:transcriptional regulator with XRE-family HTH domain
VNEALCRALLRAGLNAEDAAARLGVDPKTMRRWMEGRALPYPRHRWALAAMLDTDEADLWPQLRDTRPRPEEVQTVYPHRDAVPRDVWLRLFGSAKHKIAILDDDGLFLAQDPQILDMLAELARAEVSVRICLADPDALRSGDLDVAPAAGRIAAADTALALFAPLSDFGEVEIRLHRAVLYSSIYRIDNQLLVAQHIHGIPAGQAPVLHLRSSARADLADTHLRSLNCIWANTRPLE